MDQLDLKNGWTFYQQRRSDALYRPPWNEACGQGGTHVGNPPGYLVIVSETGRLEMRP